jgi:hypothetical protein
LCAARHPQAARCAQVKTGRKHQQRDNIQAGVPVGNRFHFTVFDGQPVNDAEDGCRDGANDAREELIERDPISPDRITAPQVN